MQEAVPIYIEALQLAEKFVTRKDSYKVITLKTIEEMKGLSNSSPISPCVF